MLSNPAAPQLDTNLIEPFKLMEEKFYLNCHKIKEWFTKEWALTTPPIYGSVDLRNAGFKIAPIDMNLFPAGFNNLNPNYLSLAIDAAKHAINQSEANVKNILIIPESHTRNLFYWENIKTLQMILTQAGFHVRLATLDENLKAPHKIELPIQGHVLLEGLERHENRVQLKDFMPDLVLLNNDLSDGIPPILQNLSQELFPPAELGWHQRLKSEHFQYYAEVVDDFAKLMDIDPWLLAPLFRHCGNIDFMTKEGSDCLIRHAEVLFKAIENKYKEYNIPHQPFLIVKADAGTYGMAVMTIRSIDELTNLNRKQRTRMSATKGGQPVKRVIIQEGVYTFEVWGQDRAVAEPVVYLLGSDVIGGFYRIHQDRGNDENLNSPGMRFEPMPFPRTCHEPCQENGEDSYPNRYFVYGIVAQLSMLAAAREIATERQAM